VEAGLQVPPQSISSEEEVLGAILVVPDMLNLLLVELHLAPEHFYYGKHEMIYRCMVAMHDRGQAIDQLLVCDELRRREHLDEVGGQHYVHDLAGKVTVVYNAEHHAKLIIEKAEWRMRLEAGQRIQAAVYTEDVDELARAEELLTTDADNGTTDYDADQLADIAFNLMDSGGTETFPWPLERLNQLTAGGIRRGELVVVSGHTSHGKSVFLDQLLDNVARRGKKVRLYMNEMDLDQRVARMLARRTGVPYGRIVQGKASPDQAKRIIAELNRGLSWGITTIAGWTAEEVGHHIRRRRWDLAVVDHLHEFDYEGEEDIRRMISLFARTAKLANCGLVVGAQLNERRVVSNTLPRPTISDLKGSSQIKQASDTICFVYREQDSDTAEPLDEGAVYLGKGRNQQVGGLKVHFDSKRLRFVAVDDREGPPL
jgi:replicative DNA helicase